MEKLKLTPQILGLSDWIDIIPFIHWSKGTGVIACLGAEEIIYLETRSEIQLEDTDEAIGTDETALGEFEKW